MEYLACAAIGYALGCINFAYIISKIKGFDIREKGSGNAGASNITISLGWGYGVLTAVMDILKSTAAVLICKKLFPDNPVAPFLAGTCAVLGHIFPFYMKFKGGKGFASYMGMVLAINWKLCLAMAITTVILTLVTNYIAVATLAVVTIVPIYFIYIGADVPIIVILVLLAAVIYFKHRINIKRIINGEEIKLRDSNKHRVM